MHRRRILGLRAATSYTYGGRLGHQCDDCLKWWLYLGGFTLVAIPRWLQLGSYSSVATLWQLYLGGYTLVAITGWPQLGGYTSAAAPWWLYLGGYTGGLRNRLMLYPLVLPAVPALVASIRDARRKLFVPWSAVISALRT
jgi:hypothetical protein